MIVRNFLRVDRSGTPPAEFAHFSAPGGYPPLLSYWSPQVSRHRSVFCQRSKSFWFNITATMPTNMPRCLLSDLLTIRLVSQVSVLERVGFGLLVAAN